VKCEYRYLNNIDTSCASLVRTISSASIFAKEIAEISLTGRAFAQCVFKNKSRTCRGNLDFDTGRRISWSTDQLCVWQRGIYKQEG
jgi:hypothetical protein